VFLPLFRDMTQVTPGAYWIIHCMTPLIPSQTK
jgi:hypothetical protein